MSETTVCILVYNNPIGCKELLNDFHRIHAHEIDKFRFIVLDQTAEGMTFEKGIQPHLHIKSYRNLGFSKGMNTMWKLVTTPYVLLANDDVRLLHEDWYKTARACVEKDGVLAVNPFPALRTWDGGGNPIWYWEQNEKFAWTKDKTYDSYTEEDYKRLQSLLSSGDGPGTTMFFTLIKNEAREIVGLLDEAYWCGGEDYDWNRRCFLKGYKILTCTHSLVHHESSVSKQNAVKAKEANGYEFVAKNKNVFNAKWSNETCKNPDIYGKNGVLTPNTPFVEQPL